MPSRDEGAMDDLSAAPPPDQQLPGTPIGGLDDGSTMADVDPSTILPIDHYELDGIPLYHMPMAGATILTLAFGVGRADEPVVDGGMTHLAEHLLLTDILNVFDHSNGTTEPFRVTFVTRGTPQDVSRFLKDLCVRIERPRLGRMYQEANVLRTEAAGRGGMGFSLRLLYMRTGYQGIGTVGLPEFFLDRLDEGRLRDWMATNLVAGNAAIWIAGAIPDDLEVMLPPGPARPRGEHPVIDGFETPTAVSDEAPGVGVSFVVRRNVATGAALRTLNRWLMQRLRVDRGLAYDIGAEYLPTGPDHAFVTVWATCLPNVARDVQRIVLETIDDVANRGPTPEEISRDYQGWLRDAADPRAIPARLDAHVRDVLLGGDHVPRAVETMIDEQWRLDSAPVAAAMREARDSMLLFIPPSGEDPQRPLKRYPGPAAGSMAPDRVFEFAGGEKKRFRRATSPLRLTVGRVGTSVDTVDGRRLMAVPWADCVGVIRERGIRSLLGRDGTVLQVFEQEWRDGGGALVLVDHHTPPAVVIDATQPGSR
jgi:hypothetical protein